MFSPSTPLAILIALIEFPLLLHAGPDSRLMEEARQRAARMGEMIMGQRLTSVVSEFEKPDGSRAFELVSMKREGEMILQRGGKVMNQPIQQDPGEPAEGEFSRISLFHHEGKIYVKEEMSSNLQGRSEKLLPFEGTYEAVVVEGSWEGYEKGGKLVLRLCADCRKRYASDIDEYLSSPDRLSAVEKQIRKDYLAMHERIFEKESSNTTPEAKRIREQFPAIRYLIQNASIAIAVSQSGQESVTYTVHGDKMTTKVGKSSSETRFHMSLP
ncbi:MAG: hypothetical protein P1U87_03250 [Verrucomicrobiales bacterium]|nr:hypothetical protein [Verrucomicrobiales bacterium]